MIVKTYQVIRKNRKHEPVLTTSVDRGRERDGVVEGETERLMDVLATPAVVEEVLLEVICDREELAARRVRRGVLPVRARDATGERSCKPQI